jgi:uncharacterized protein
MITSQKMIRIVATIILATTFLYLWKGLIRRAALPMKWHRVATGLLLLSFISIPLTFMFWEEGSLRLGRWIAYPAFIWIGMLLYFFPLLIGGDLFRLGLWVKLRKQKTPEPENHYRRLFINRSIAASITTVAGIGGGSALYFGTRRPAVKKVQVDLQRLPASLSGLRIVQLTDLHIGPLLGRQWLEDVVKQTNALSPDLIAITGDVVDGSVDRLRTDIRPLADLKARFGSFLVTGNHEYYAGIDHWLPHFRQLGLKVLLNERVSIGDGDESFDLIGINDFNAGRRRPDHRPNLPLALKGRDTSREAILLAHQPRAIHEAAELDIGLQLSGHTHGGQMWPWHYFVYLQQPYLSGLHRHKETQIYISHGTGFWGPPMRLASRAEITEITLGRSKT